MTFSEGCREKERKRGGVRAGFMDWDTQRVKRVLVNLYLLVKLVLERF